MEGRMSKHPKARSQATPEVARAEGAGDPYLDLIRRLPLRPIRSEEDLDRATAMMNGLLDREDLDPGEGDYLDVLSDLVEKYEAEHHAIAPASDAEVLRHLIEARDLTQARVAEDTGIAESTISAVLTGKRTLNRKQIGTLARYFLVHPATFLAAE